MCGPLVSRTDLFAIVLSGGKRRKVPIEQLRSGLPEAQGRLVHHGGSGA